jgi:hypothetical protein
MRQQQLDLSQLLQWTRDLNQEQARLFLLVNRLLRRYEAPELQPLQDDDIAEAAAALAGTFETAAKGIIYEHRPSAQAADRLAGALRPAIVEAGKRAGSSFERDAAVVLRRVEEAARHARRADRDNPRAYVNLLGRLLGDMPEPDDSSGSSEDGPTRLIVP